MILTSYEDSLRYFLEMEDFVHMMLMTPVAALLMTYFGLPLEAGALLGLLVPMFLMQQINLSDHHQHPQAQVNK